MDHEKYLTNRVNNQIIWYNKKSRRNKAHYYILRSIEIIAAAIIPFLSGNFTGETTDLRIYVGILGVIIIIITAIISLFQFQENWISYRTTSETLKHEKNLFLTKVEPYNIENHFSLFVQRVESLISKENTNWFQYIKPKKELKNG